MLGAKTLPTLTLLSAAVTVAAPAIAAEPAAPKLRGPRVALRPFYRGNEAPPPPVAAPPTTPPKSPYSFNPDPGQWNKPPGAQPAPTPPTVQAPITGATPPVVIAPPPPYVEPLAPDFSLLFPPQPLATPTLPAIPVVRSGASPVYAGEPVPDGLALPRRSAHSPPFADRKFHYPEYPLGREGLGLLPYSQPVENRWMLNFPHWTRYHDPTIETPYQYSTPRLWHPYQQSILKGDVPIIGQEIFMNITAKNFTLAEARKLPTPSGISAAQPNSSEFFGRSEQYFINNDTSIAIDLFKGETAFKPVHWAIRLLGVYNQNYLWVKENNVVDPDPRGSDYQEPTDPLPETKEIQAIPAIQDSLNPQTGIPAPFTSTVNPGDVFNYIAPQLVPLGNAKPLVQVDPETNEVPTDVDKGEEQEEGNVKEDKKDLSGTRYTRRFKQSFALQEAFAEIHISDLSDNYDFISTRTGIQPFVSDFRGFIFNDTNLGFRVFGNLDNNRVQYNFAAFDQLEKDTYSDLNTFDSRRQKVFITNVYKQDFLVKGYTTQFSFHANLDDGGVFYDQNGFIVRPAPLGTLETIDNGVTNHLQDKKVKAFYFGWTGDGHIGRINVNHAFYQVYGEDEFNGLAGHRVDINARMAALELSYDRDYLRFKLSGFYASGDSDPTDRTAEGFDTILDNPFFIGGPFSWYVHQGFNLAGTSVNFKQRDSLVPNLRTSKTQGQSNFVNPGVLILGAAIDAEITPKLKGFLNVNYIWLSDTKSIEYALMSNKIDNNLGLDASLGFKFRPLLTQNIVLSAGVGFFLPGSGYKSIYRRSSELLSETGATDEEGEADDYLYNAFMTLTLVY